MSTTAPKRVDSYSTFQASANTIFATAEANYKDNYPKFCEKNKKLEKFQMELTSRIELAKTGEYSLGMKDGTSDEFRLGEFAKTLIEINDFSASLEGTTKNIITCLIPLDESSEKIERIKQINALVQGKISDINTLKESIDQLSKRWFADSTQVKAQIDSFNKIISSKKAEKGKKQYGGVEALISPSARDLFSHSPTDPSWDSVSAFGIQFSSITRKSSDSETPFSLTSSLRHLSSLGSEKDGEGSRGSVSISSVSSTSMVAVRTLGNVTGLLSGDLLKNFSCPVLSSLTDGSSIGGQFPSMTRHSSAPSFLFSLDPLRRFSSLGSLEEGDLALKKSDGVDVRRLSENLSPTLTLSEKFLRGEKIPIEELEDENDVIAELTPKPSSRSQSTFEEALISKSELRSSDEEEVGKDVHLQTSLSDKSRFSKAGRSFSSKTRRLLKTRKKKRKNLPPMDLDNCNKGSSWWSSCISRCKDIRK